jgi:dihydropyrimidinase
MEVDLVIEHATVATASDTLWNQDIAISNDKIVLLGQQTSSFISAKRRIDALGAFVTPGGIDSHVHLDQDNAPTGDNFETGTRSAIAGGTTTVIAFAAQTKGDDSVLRVVEEYHSRANGKAYCDYGFHLILTNPSDHILDKELPKLMKDGISSVKLYMTYARLQLSDHQILDIMSTTRKLGMTTMIHAENADMIAWLTAKLEAKGFRDPYYHAVSRPSITEDEATYRAIALSQLSDTPILIVHMSSGTAASHVRDAQTRLLPIYAETCPHYLFLTSDAMKNAPDFEGAKCVCSPPLRSDSKDLEAMWQSLANGTFTTVSSDHAPDTYDHPKGKKAAFADGSPTFRKIPNGLPGVETRLASLMSEGVMGGRLSINQFVALTSTNHAKLYGFADRKGTIAPGLDADLTIWYPTPEQARMYNGLRKEKKNDSGKDAAPMMPFHLSNEMLHHSIDYTPFEGMVIRNWPRYTIVRGEIVWDREGGGLVGKMEYGDFIKRGRSTLPGSRNRWVNEFQATRD